MKMKRLFTLLTFTLLSITAFSQDIFNEPSAINRVNPLNFNKMLDNHYGFISNGTYYILAYPIDYEYDPSGIKPYISRELGLYSWVNDMWVLASKDIVSLDDRRIFDSKKYFNTVTKKEYYGFSKIWTFGDTIVMLITYQYKIEYHSYPPKSSDVYIYNTINIFIPKGDGKYNIIKRMPETKETKFPIWNLDDDVIKDGNKFTFKFMTGNYTIEVK